MSFLGNVFNSVNKVTRNIPIVGDVVSGLGDIVGGAPSVDPTIVKSASTAPVTDQQKVNVGLIKDLQGRMNTPASAAPQMSAVMANRGDVQNVAANQMGNVTADQTSRDAQLRALALQEQAALGNAPSAAEMQMQSGLNTAIQNQMAMARSGRGGYNPAAIRGAMQQGSQMQQQGILQQGALRAQEMQTAREGMTGAAGALSNRDVQQAQMNQQILIANTDNKMKADLANQGVDLDVLKTNAATGNAAAQQNLAAQLQKMGLDNSMIQAYLNGIVGLQGGNLAAGTSMYGTQQGVANAQSAARTNMFGSIIGAGGQVAAAAV